MTPATPPAVSNARAEPAAPEYALGQVVGYADKQGRRQRGEVLAIEANWRVAGRSPLIIYTVAHPSYVGRRFYCTAIEGGFRP